MNTMRATSRVTKGRSLREVAVAAKRDRLAGLTQRRCVHLEPRLRDDGDRNRRPTAGDAGSGPFARARRLAGRPFPLVVEMAFVALVILIWELARMPLEGPLPLALAHARDWLSVEHTLHLDVEASLIRAAHRTDTLGALLW